MKQIDSGAKTTEKSLAIVDALVELDGATIDELADHLGMAPSTVHRHLVTLREHNYVRAEKGEYHIGLQFLTKGGYAQRRVTGFAHIKQKVDGLAERTGERAQFIVREGGERVYLYTEVGESAVQTGAHIGKRGAIHTSAAGKAILAALPREDIEEIIDVHGLPQKTANSITDRDALDAELEEIRERGYAVNKQETTKGVHAVGAVVTDSEGVPVGGLSVSGPANRVREDRIHDELPDLILAAVNELELYIAHAVEP